MIKILVIKPNEEPTVCEIEDGEEFLQGIIGGDVETVPIGFGVVAILNAEGLLKELPLNRMLKGLLVRGIFIIVGMNTRGELVSLTKRQINRWSTVLKDPLPTQDITRRRLNCG